MQTNTQKEDPKGKKPDRKTQLLKLRSDGRLKKEEEQELKELEAAEKLERERGALLHKLTTEAAAYGRNSCQLRLRDTTEKVKATKNEENTKYLGLCTSASDKAREAQAVADEAINDIRKELEVTLRSIYHQRDEQVQEMRMTYKPIYEEAETSLTQGEALVESECKDFVDALEILTVEQLRELHSRGVVEVVDEGEQVWIGVPGRAA